MESAHRVARSVFYFYFFIFNTRAVDEVTEGVEGTQNLKATNSHSSLLLSITTNLKF